MPNQASERAEDPPSLKTPEYVPEHSASALICTFALVAKYEMTKLQYVWRLFSLDTLDTRFIAASKGTKQAYNEQLSADPAKPSSNLEDSNDGAGKPIEEGSRSRWGSREFFLYWLVLLVAIPLMFKSAYDVSNREANPP